MEDRVPMDLSGVLRCSFAKVKIYCIMCWLSGKCLLLIIVWTFDLMKCIHWTLGAIHPLDVNMPEYHWISKNITSHHLVLNTFCIEKKYQTVQVCSCSSKLADLGNTKRHLRMLAFRINNTDFRVFLNTRQINLPNASISHRAESNNEIYMYREDISNSIYVFYEGNFVVNDLSLPFSAEWNGAEFAGTTFFHKFYFKLVCKVKDSMFFMKDHCLYFSATCSNIKLTKNDNHAHHANEDFLQTDYKYHDLDSSQTFFMKRELLRKHRSTPFPPVPVSCVLHLVADHLFFKYIGDGSLLKTVNVMLSVINGADAIFRSTDFDGDGQGDNVGFIIGKVTVFSKIHDPSYTLAKAYLEANDYLKMFSYYDFDKYCLGLAFTYRDFNGLAGSAFQAYSDNYLPGGICQKRLKHNFHMVSYNTAVTTFLNYGRRLDKSSVILILAHEMGHAFGASHDVTTECLPDKADGYYLMSATITFGELPNNPRFSDCSVKAMLPVIKKKGSCLVFSEHISQCGNTIPEMGEECDCGTSGICHIIDPCCTPADADDHDDKPCTIQRSKGKLCSPMVNSCCTHSCMYISSSERKVCNQLSECSLPSFCDGLSSHCPFNGYLSNGTLCNQGVLICNGGKCSQGVCEYYNLTNCICTDPEGQCKLCCKDPWTLACQPASSYGVPNTGEEIYYEPGMQCFNRGFCDSSLNCQKISSRKYFDTSIFGFKTAAELERYLKNYWLHYVFTIFCILFIITVLLLPYRLNDNRRTKALRYGKMLAVFATGEHQTKIYRQILTDIDDHYFVAVLRLHGSCQPMGLTEAIGRLTLFFPEVHTNYLYHVAKLSASEGTAIKILLLQGFKMRTFTKCQATYQ